MPGGRPKPLDAEGLWQFALRSLAARAQSAGQLRDKLTRRAERPEDVAEILRRLKEAGYLDDRRFAEAYTSTRLEDQGFGKARVYRDLHKKRIAPGLARQAVESAYQGTDELQLIRQFLERHHRGGDLGTYLADPKHLLSAYRKLRLAGFASGNVLRVLKGYAAEPELLDTLEDGEEETRE